MHMCTQKPCEYIPKFYVEYYFAEIVLIWNLFGILSKLKHKLHMKLEMPSFFLFFFFYFVIVNEQDILRLTVCFTK